MVVTTMNRKLTKDKRSERLLLSLTIEEAEWIRQVADKLGLTKVDLVLHALKRQFNNPNKQDVDFCSKYVAKLNEELALCEQTIKANQQRADAIKSELNMLKDIISLDMGEE